MQKVQKESSESLGSLEAICESGTNDLLRWRAEAAESAEAFAAEASALDGKLRDTVEEARKGQEDYFERGLRRDAPTGETPDRATTQSRIYPRDIVKVGVLRRDAPQFPKLTMFDFYCSMFQ